jgi:hypothetical protein
MAADHGEPAGAALRGALLGLVGLAGLLSAAPAAQAQTSTPSLERRLQRAEDELAITRLLVDYSWTQDARDFRAYTELFAREGEWVTGTTVYRGRPAILAMLVGIYGETPLGFVNSESFHVTSNPEIEVEGDRATARSRHLLVMRGPDGLPQPALAGRYEDDLIREDGRWKILRRVDHQVMPTAEEWREIMRSRR